MTLWLDQVDALLQRDEPGVLVSVVSAEGSTPRDSGTRMVVTQDAILGTIGGGNLEHRATTIARELLDADEPSARVNDFPLGPSLGQCCGGRAVVHFQRLARAADQSWVDALQNTLKAGNPAVLVTDVDGAPVRRMVVTANSVMESPAQSFGRISGSTIRQARTLLRGGELEEPSDRFHFEVLGPEALQIVLFGAGHVGCAVVSVLAHTACHLTWVDSREEQFPPSVPNTVTTSHSDAPELEVANAPRGAFFLVMTHSHALDLRLVEAVLKRGDFAYLGLIGSATKRARFETRLRNRGIPEASLRRLTCPIGVNGITGKAPGTIAISAAAQILRLHEGSAAHRNIERSA